MPWLLYGKTADGDLLHISEAERGDKSHCQCPFCDRLLVAKKGNVKVHHFAHQGETCAWSSVYDFLHIESNIDTSHIDSSKGLVPFAKWKLVDIENNRKELREGVAKWEAESKRIMPIIHEGLAILEEITKPHPKRKERSKARQANFEVLEQTRLFLRDHNASFPDFHRIRDPESKETYQEYGIYWYERIPTLEFKLGVTYPGELWMKERNGRRFALACLKEMITALHNTFPKVRRNLINYQQKLSAFEAELSRFQQFRLYLLLIELPSQQPLFKIGITSRLHINERVAEIRQDLRELGESSIHVLFELRGFAFLESYFKKKFAAYQVKIKSLTEYFRFPEPVFDHIEASLHRLTYLTTDRKEKIKQGMAQAKTKGAVLGRPKAEEAVAAFLRKPKSKKIVELLEQGLKFREIERQTGYSINTIRKVANLIK